MLLEQIEAWVLSMSGAPWVYPALFAIIVIDGFFPPIPSESVVIPLAVATQTGEGPRLWGVLLAAILGAWCGDQIAFAIGRRVGTDRVRFLRGRRGQATVRWARRALSRRGAAFIIAARYVPVGRIAVNMTAGAVGYSRRRFMEYSAVASVLWGFYVLGMGLLASVWLYERPLLAMAAGIVLGVLVGLLIERLVHLVMRRRGVDVDDALDDEVLDGGAGASVQDGGAGASVQDDALGVTASAAAPAEPSGRRPS